MPLFLIERQFAEQIQLSPEGLEAIGAVNDDIGVEWIHSFLSADQRKTYCLYQAASADDVLKAAKAANLPADNIVEVSKFVPG